MSVSNVHRDRIITVRKTQCKGSAERFQLYQVFLCLHQNRFPTLRAGTYNSGKLGQRTSLNTASTHYTEAKLLLRRIAAENPLFGCRRVALVCYRHKHCITTAFWLTIKKVIFCSGGAVSQRTPPRYIRICEPWKIHETPPLNSVTFAPFSGFMWQKNGRFSRFQKCPKKNISSNPINGIFFCAQIFFKPCNWTFKRFL